MLSELSSMDRKPEIEKKLLDLFQEFSPKIEVAKDAYHLSVSFGEKKAEMIWPYPLHEVFSISGMEIARYFQIPLSSMRVSPIPSL